MGWVFSPMPMASFASPSSPSSLPACTTTMAPTTPVLFRPIFPLPSMLHSARMGSGSKVLVFGLVLVNVAVLCNGGSTNTFLRRKEEKAVNMPLDSDVFAIPLITMLSKRFIQMQGDHEEKTVIVSWTAVMNQAPAKCNTGARTVSKRS
ncbi:hypothetical protein AHAS_Ahas19G0238900 [Arachis hypogaea]